MNRIQRSRMNPSPNCKGRASFCVRSLECLDVPSKTFWRQQRISDLPIRGESFFASGIGSRRRKVASEFWHLLERRSCGRGSIDPERAASAHRIGRGGLAMAGSSGFNPQASRVDGEPLALAGDHLGVVPADCLDAQPAALDGDRLHLGRHAHADQRSGAVAEPCRLRPSRDGSSLPPGASGPPPSVDLPRPTSACGGPVRLPGGLVRIFISTSLRFCRSIFALSGAVRLYFVFIPENYCALRFAGAFGIPA